VPRRARASPIITPAAPNGCRRHNNCLYILARIQTTARNSHINRSRRPPPRSQDKSARDARAVSLALAVLLAVSAYVVASRVLWVTLGIVLP
jgi:hypothetical protein